VSEARHDDGVSEARHDDAAAGAPRPSRARTLASAMPAPGARSRLSSISAWLAQTRPGLVVMALAVGGGAGLGAAAFRELIFGFTWIFTGHQSFGQQGHAASAHLRPLGIWFVVLVPVIGGLIYGPLIQRFAREARGHGVPEVMLAVAENGGRIRPPVTIVKALASALCIGTGGSVGREGPIVQIGSAFASSAGQLVHMSESRLRIIVACGAAGGISATFNAPLTGLFFGFEIVLREFSLDALLATSLAAVSADLISRAFFGSGPFFGPVPHEIPIANDLSYLLVAVLAICAGLIGWGFKSVLYRLEDIGDALWKGRPEWARPAVGGVLLGVILLALPALYGVGYPVMDRVLANHEAVWFMVVLVLGKVLAASVTLAIGGSGGVFAPSLFTGAAAGMAFGVAVHDLFGSAAGPPALYGVVAMGGVFAGAAQAPLTSIASVVEMTGNFTLTLPVMLICGIASALSKRLSYGSIYTTKLLRRGIDIERPKAAAALRAITVAEVMQPLGKEKRGIRLSGAHTAGGGIDAEAWERLIGPVSYSRSPQALFEDEDLEQALRQLVLYGRDGLPVLSHDARELCGWVTRNDVLSALGGQLEVSSAQITAGAEAAELQHDDGSHTVDSPSTPLLGYEVLELRIDADSPARDRPVAELDWPQGAILVAVTEGREVRAPRPSTRLRVGERVIVLAPSTGSGEQLQATGGGKRAG
jgi:CIC family chloride channel protein